MSLKDDLLRQADRDLGTLKRAHHYRDHTAHIRAWRRRANV